MIAWGNGEGNKDRENGAFPHTWWQAGSIYFLIKKEKDESLSNFFRYLIWSTQLSNLLWKRTFILSWLIEVNASPSLTASSKEDYDLKFGLLEDVMYVLDMEGK